MLSLDAYSNGEIFTSYLKKISRFLERGGRLVWGLVPTNFEPFGNESLASLEARLAASWGALVKGGIDLDFLLSRSLLSPATCCLVNPDGEKTVEAAFKLVRELSHRLRKKFDLV